MIEQKKLGLLVSGFVIILIGIVFLQNSANVVADATEGKRSANETIVITSGSGETLSNRVTSLIFFGNTSNNTNINAGVVIGSHVNFTRNGSVNVAQNLNISGSDPAGGIVFGNGNYLIQYNYEGANYISEASSRAVTRLIPLFLSLAIMAIGAGIAYMGFKEDFGNF